MNESMEIPENQRQSGEKNSNRRKSSGRVYLTFFAVLLLWAGLVGGGYYYARLTFDNAVRDIQQTNALNVQVLQDRLDTMDAEIRGIKETLQMADETLSSSGLTQRELNEKIKGLDNQLQELEKSLKILKEAPNAAR